MKDASDAAVPAAAVTLTNLNTSQSREALTDTAGGYNFQTVLPGQYRIRVTKEGFAPLEQTNITATTDNTARVDVTLKVGGVTETVLVEAGGRAPDRYRRDSQGPDHAGTGKDPDGGGPQLLATAEHGARLHPAD